MLLCCGVYVVSFCTNPTARRGHEYVTLLCLSYLPSHQLSDHLRADVLTVISRGQYVGLDPLRLHGEDGWMSAVDQAPVAEIARSTHPEFDIINRGAAFRLVLRNAAQVSNGLGPKITEEQGSEMLIDWAQQLQNGKLLLFLSSVTKVSLYQWKDGSDPTLVSLTSKSILCKCGMVGSSNTEALHFRWPLQQVACCDT